MFRREVGVNGVVSGLVYAELVVVQRIEAALLARAAVHGGWDHVPTAVHVGQEAAVDRRRGRQRQLTHLSIWSFTDFLVECWANSLVPIWAINL